MTELWRLNPTFRPSPCWGAKIKKHRNQLIYGALNDFLKAFVKSFVFVSAERQALELILSQNLIKPQTTDNQVQITT